jgi:hypothetical protein
MTVRRQPITKEPQVERIILDNENAFCHQAPMTSSAEPTDRRPGTASGNGSYPTAGEAQALALGAIGWIVAEPGRAERFLSLTGLDPAQLRERLGEASVLVASLDFLLSHEPDLLACAEGLGCSPGSLVAARAELAR